MNSSEDSHFKSPYRDLINGNGPVTIEDCNESFEDENDIDDEEEDGMDPDQATNSLPRPPTKPNVAIEDETICPVCTQKG